MHAAMAFQEGSISYDGRCTDAEWYTDPVWPLVLTSGCRPPHVTHRHCHSLQQPPPACCLAPRVPRLQLPLQGLQCTMHDAALPTVTGVCIARRVLRCLIGRYHRMRVVQGCAVPDAGNHGHGQHTPHMPARKDVDGGRKRMCPDVHCSKHCSCVSHSKKKEMICRCHVVDACEQCARQQSEHHVRSPTLTYIERHLIIEPLSWLQQLQVSCTQQDIVIVQHFNLSIFRTHLCATNTAAHMLMRQYALICVLKIRTVSR